MWRVFTEYKKRHLRVAQRQAEDNLQALLSHLEVVRQDLRTLQDEIDFVFEDLDALHRRVKKSRRKPEESAPSSLAPMVLTAENYQH
jgi:chromosome segregation ATPase